MRESIEPTYDATIQGDRYQVTTYVNDRVIGTYCRPISCPFVHTTTYVGLWRTLWSLIRYGGVVVRVDVHGDPEIIEDVLELNADYKGRHDSTRRMQFDLDVNDVLGRT